MSDLYTYYQQQINKIDKPKTDYPPLIKITHGEDKTNWLSLNDDSATVLVKFLTDNYNIAKL